MRKTLSSHAGVLCAQLRGVSESSGIIMKRIVS